MFNLKISKKDFAKYPLLAPLLEISDIPKSLNFKVNNENILDNFLHKKFNGKDYKVLTIVGSRKNSLYGKDILNSLLESLEGETILIVSGLALGIDAYAHRGALEYKFKTLAIPGSGLGEKIIYPASNRTLARDILEQGNLLISEYEEEVKGEKYFFPARNRLMAAISDAVLIIEASEQSGTLITARLAMEYGKEVGVIPNNILALGSVGSNKLMQAGAMPILEADDILDLLHLENKKSRVLDLSSAEFQEKIESLSETEQILYKLILKAGSLEKNALLEEVSQEINSTASLVALMSLEIKGLIKEELGEVRLRK